MFENKRVLTLLLPLVKFHRMWVVEVIYNGSNASYHVFKMLLENVMYAMVL
jgi:hypothetical protein